MQPVRDAGEGGLEILPVVVVTQTFQARPSSVPDIREFVRRQLAHTSLSADDVRLLGGRVAEVLLNAAGTGGAIHVSLRMFADYAEVDVLETAQGAAVGTTSAIGAPSSAARVPRRPPGGPAASAASEGKVAPGPVPAAATPQRPGIPFAEWLAEALRREGMTMEAAARQLRVSVKTVGRWVRGATEPRLGDLSRIREIFGDVPFP
jgi:hypothetical protein